MHSFCLRLLDDPAEADDAVADVFLVAAQRIGQLRQPESFRAWLYAIARRRVQRRWQDRHRTTPVDPHGDAIMSTSITDHGAEGGADAAELVAAASVGLSDRDRELLALTLGADLDTAEVARITGEATNAVAVRVSRLKDTVGRAAGALLVARHHRTDCDELAGILGGWDGTFDTVWRKRIARHVDRCDGCSQRRRSATAVFAAPLLLAAPSDLLRDRVMAPLTRGPETPADATADATADLGPWDDDGFPSRTRRHRWPLIAVATVAVIVAIVGIGWANGDGGRDVTTEANGTTNTSTTSIDTDDPTSPDPTVTSTTPGPSTTLSPSPVGPGQTPTEIAAPAPGNDDAGPSEGSGQELANPTPPPAAPPPTASDPVALPTPTVTTLPAVPTVTISVSPTDVVAGSTSMATATLHVAAPAGGAVTRVAWAGPSPGSVIVNGTGPLTVAIGPFIGAPASPTGAGPVTVTASTTDALGRTGSASTALIVRAVPG